MCKTLNEATSAYDQSIAELLKRGKALQGYSVVPIDLGVARLNGAVFNYAGDSLTVINQTGLADIAFNEPTNDFIPVYLSSRFTGVAFRRFYVRNTAQLGRVLLLFIGRASLLDATQGLIPVVLVSSSGAIVPSILTNYDYVPVDLGVARLAATQILGTDGLPIVGQALTVKTMTPLATAQLVFSDPTFPVIDTQVDDNYEDFSFTNIYVLNAAQPGAVMNLWIGKP